MKIFILMAMVLIALPCATTNRAMAVPLLHSTEAEVVEAEQNKVFPMLHPKAFEFYPPQVGAGVEGGFFEPLQTFHPIAIVEVGGLRWNCHASPFDYFAVSAGIAGSGFSKTPRAVLWFHAGDRGTVGIGFAPHSHALLEASAIDFVKDLRDLFWWGGGQLGLRL